MVNGLKQWANDRFWLVVSGVLLLAWGMMLYNLALESLWYDEWITWDFSRQGPVGLTHATADDVHPPLYYVWVWLWLTLTGSEHVFVMRLTSAIPALLAVALSYRLGVEWFRSRWAGLGAAVFIATSGIFIYYARELRMYTFVVMLAVLSWLLLWRYLTGKQKYPWGYTLTVILMAYTYYFTVFMVAIQALVVLLFYRQRLLKLIGGYGVVGLALLPWIPIFIHQIELEGSRAGQEGAIGKFAATDPTNLATIGTFIQHYTAGQAAFVLLLVGLALFLGWRSDALTRHSLTVSGLWLFGTMGLFFGINLFVPVYNLRYVLLVIPALALIVGSVTRHFSNATQPVLVLLIGAGALLFHFAAFLPPKLAHGELLPMLAERYQPGDRIWYNLSDGALGSSLNFEGRYYMEVVVPELNTDWFIWDAPREFAQLEANPRVWDVRPYWIPMPPQAETPLLTGRALVSEEVLRIYTLRLYAAAPQTEPAVFAETLALQVSPLAQTTYQSGQTVSVVTWWQALQAPPLDYSYGLFLRDAAGAVITQVDAGLLLADRPSSQWNPQADFAPLNLALSLPPDLPAGEYGLWLSAYYWEDPQPLPLAAGELCAQDQNLLQLARITVGG